eukprot:gnl/MRDRNA2_/MRDRNA2_123394_c0_seq1.p1 gnl/MRDRNA2_/MRDRNA2_123394_c0~~gnl/MRDRNA2_/MRDRNA2_123394_c0_seq1.p1  ORF type:complete len:130 (+),score=26.27 gnl/MRDRNA2_/MRDRNA2_123394_c0_seq1:103-492(+)
MAAIIGKMLQKGAVKVAAEVAGGVAQQVLTPPPPKVWCVTLRRRPPLTEEDQPEIGDCEKFCMKLFLIPFALITYIFGWVLYTIIYTIGTCCCPLVGPQFFVMLAQSRLQQMAAVGPVLRSNAPNEKGC